MVSISASEGALAEVHILGLLARVPRRRIPVLGRAVDVGAAIGDVADLGQVVVGVMMRISRVAIWLVLAGSFALSLALAGAAQAQTAPSGVRTSQPGDPEVLAQRKRPPTRLRVQPNYEAEPDGVYPRYYPGRNAVRECNATYVQEYRPSGTVIVPRMNCAWRQVRVGNY
jgi:hypothetical protein